MVKGFQQQHYQLQSLKSLTYLQKKILARFQLWMKRVKKERDHVEGIQLIINHLL
jgi:hypothetical protein